MATASYCLASKEYMWIDYCLALFVAILRRVPYQPIKPEVLQQTGALLAEDDEQGKFYLLLNEAVLAGQAGETFLYLQPAIMALADSD